MAQYNNVKSLVNAASFLVQIVENTTSELTMFPFGKKAKDTKHTQIGIINTKDNFTQQIGIINIDDSQSNNSDNYGNSDDSQGASIGILNEPGAMNYGTQIDIQYNIDL